MRQNAEIPALAMLRSDMMSDRTAEEQRWQLAIENAIFGVWDLDPRLEMVQYSPQWKARLGFPQVHAPDSTAFWRCRVHPDDFEPMLRSLRGHLDGHARDYETRFRLRCNGSGYRTVLSRGRVVARDQHGNATRMIGTMVDLTCWPATAASHGLAAESPIPAFEMRHTPFHKVLGAARPRAVVAGAACEAVAARRSDAANELHGFVDLVDDLLDQALREATAVP